MKGFIDKKDEHETLGPLAQIQKKFQTEITLCCNKTNLILMIILNLFIEIFFRLRICSLSPYENVEVFVLLFIFRGFFLVLTNSLHHSELRVVFFFLL